MAGSNGNQGGDIDGKVVCDLQGYYYATTDVYANIWIKLVERTYGLICKMKHDEYAIRKALNIRHREKRTRVQGVGYQSTHSRWFLCNQNFDLVKVSVKSS